MPLGRCLCHELTSSEMHVRKLYGTQRTLGVREGQGGREEEKEVGGWKDKGAEEDEGEKDKEVGRTR